MCAKTHQARFQIYVQSGPLATTGDDLVGSFESQQVGMDKQPSSGHFLGVCGGNDLIANHDYRPDRHFTHL